MNGKSNYFRRCIWLVSAQWGLRLESGIKSVYYGYKFIQLDKRWLAQTGFQVTNSLPPAGRCSGVYIET